MYKTIAEAVDFIEKIKPVAAKAEHCEVVVAPPFTALCGGGEGSQRIQLLFPPRTCTGTRKARTPETFRRRCWSMPAARM